jgi:hypothetical protein
MRIESEVLEYAETVRESARGAYLTACAGELSPQSAIKAFCMYCTGYDRRAISVCSARTCPLWMYRPFASSGLAEASDKSIQKAI